MSTVLTFDLSLLYNKNSYILVNVFGLINRIIKLDIRDILVYLYQCILLQLILGHVRWILKESSDQAKSVLDNLKLGRFVDLPPSVKFYQNLTVNSLGRARLASLIKAHTNFCAYQLFQLYHQQSAYRRGFSVLKNYCGIPDHPKNSQSFIFKKNESCCQRDTVVR